MVVRYHVLSCITTQVTLYACGVSAIDPLNPLRKDPLEYEIPQL